MKTYKFLILLGLGLALSPSLSAQNNTSKVKSAPSDATEGYTYDFDLAKQLILDYQINPTSSNQEVKSLISEKGFPKLSANKQADAAYHERLNEWMEKNPTRIIEALKNRKDIVHKY